MTTVPAPVRWTSRRNPWRQLGVSAVVAVATGLAFGRAVPPVPAVAWVLLAVNVVLMLVRAVPDGRLGTHGLLVVAALTVPASAVLVALDSTGSAVVFAFFFAGHIGYRLPDARGIGWAAATSVATTAALLVAGPTTDLPWWVGAVTGFTAFAGIANRSREDATLALQRAAADAAAAAEARADAAALAERNRIARELHDVLAHSLAGINLQLEAASALLEAGQPARAAAAVDAAQRAAREGMTGAGAAVRALREDTTPLLDRVRALLDDLGSPAELETRGPVGDLGPRTVAALHRCVQEALTNARKHAPGAPVTVLLEVAADVARVVVRNGRPAAGAGPLGPGSGLGLLGMRERAAQLGGTVTSGPTADGGWRVEVEIPGGGQQ